MLVNEYSFHHLPQLELPGVVPFALSKDKPIYSLVEAIRANDINKAYEALLNIDMLLTQRKFGSYGGDGAGILRSNLMNFLSYVHNEPGNSRTTFHFHLGDFCSCLIIRLRNGQIEITLSEKSSSKVRYQFERMN